MTIAVTGATGFIGRHVMAALERRGVEATAVTRRSADQAGLPERTRVVTLDILNPPGDAYDRLGRPDTVLHLAWGGLPDYGALHHFERELPAHYAFLRSLVGAGLERLVVTGTCFEYGMAAGSLREDLDVRPTNPYGFAKDTLRRQLEFLRAETPFRLTWARLFYLFGGGQERPSLFTALAAAAERGDRTFDMSGGEQLRDYLPVEEVADILVALALGGRDNGIVNVCSGSPVSVRRLVEGWIAENGWGIEPNLGHYPYSEHEPMAFWGSREKLDDCFRDAEQVRPEAHEISR